MREPRLGDDIDDYCVRCKRVMNHSVVSVINAEPAKVRCRICHSDHDFRHEQAPPPKVDARKQALFNEVLKKANPLAAEAEVAVEEPPADLPEVDAVTAAVAEMPKAKAVVQPAAAEPKPKAKPKTTAQVKVKTKARK
ncbi:MAG: hypothetical protein ABSE35_24950 [Bryobacteraceae bacterium]|jgi:hypothetical protein